MPLIIVGRSALSDHAVWADRHQAMGTCLPNAGHGKVELHKDGPERQQPGGSKQHVGIACPVGWGYVPRDLVRPRGVGRDLPPGGQQAPCVRIGESYCSRSIAVSADGWLCKTKS